MRERTGQIPCSSPYFARAPPAGVAGIALAPPTGVAGVAEAHGRVNSISVAARGAEVDPVLVPALVVLQVIKVRFTLQSTRERRDTPEMVMTMMTLSCWHRIPWR